MIQIVKYYLRKQIYNQHTTEGDANDFEDRRSVMSKSAFSCEFFLYKNVSVTSSMKSCELKVFDIPTLLSVFSSQSVALKVSSESMGV